MSKKFQDENFLVWEVFASSGDSGYDDYGRIVFHCVTDRRIRSRYVEAGDDSADATRVIERAEAMELLEMLKGSREIS